ncbi:MAG: integrase core domain-containing protein [bacterium]
MFAVRGDDKLALAARTNAVLLHRVTSLQELQSDVDDWIHHYNHDRTHSGKHCFGKTPMQTLKDSLPLALSKQLNQTLPTSASALT